MPQVNSSPLFKSTPRSSCCALKIQEYKNSSLPVRRHSPKYNTVAFNSFRSLKTSSRMLTISDNYTEQDGKLLRSMSPIRLSPKRLFWNDCCRPVVCRPKKNSPKRLSPNRLHPSLPTVLPPAPLWVTWRYRSTVAWPFDTTYVLWNGVSMSSRFRNIAL